MFFRKTPAASICVTKNGALDPSLYRVVDLGPVAAVCINELSCRIRLRAIHKRRDDRGVQAGISSDCGRSFIPGVDLAEFAAIYILKFPIVHVLVFHDSVSSSVFHGFITISEGLPGRYIETGFRSPRSVKDLNWRSFFFCGHIIAHETSQMCHTNRPEIPEYQYSKSVVSCNGTNSEMKRGKDRFDRFFYPQ